MNTMVPESIWPATRHGPGQRRPGGDAREDAALVGQAAGVLDGLTGPDDALAVEQLLAAPLLVDGRDVALVEVAQALDHLADGRLDGEDLDVGVAFLQVRADTHQRAAGAQAGDEVGDLGAVPPDLRTGGLVVRPGVGLVGVLVEERPLGVLVGHGDGPPDRPVGALVARREDDLGAEHLEELAALDRHVLGQHDLDRVALDAGDHGHGDAGVARRRLDDRLARRQRAVGLGLLDHAEGDAVLDRARRVLPLHLAEDADVGVGADPAHVDHRRVADHVEHGGVHSHRGDLQWVPGRPGRRMPTRRSGFYPSTMPTGSSETTPSTIR